MGSPQNAILTGSFVGGTTAFNISLPCEYTKFEVINVSDVGSTDVNTNVMHAFATSNMPAGSAYVSNKTSSSAMVSIENMITSNGFTFLSNTGATPNGAIVTNVSGITNAVGAVVSTITPVANGSVVRLFSTTGALQLAGMDYTTGSYVGSTSFALANVATAPGSAASAGSFMPINTDGVYYPRTRYITGVTRATQAVIALSVTHNYTVGQQVRILIPAQWGMTQLNNQIVTIVAVGTQFLSTGITNTITINVDTSSYTAFAYPTSAIAATGVSFPIVVPMGEDAASPYQNLLDDTTHNVSINGVTVGSGVQTSGSTYQWIAYAGL